MSPKLLNAYMILNLNGPDTLSFEPSKMYTPKFVAEFGRCEIPKTRPMKKKVEDEDDSKKILIGKSSLF